MEAIGGIGAQEIILIILVFLIFMIIIGFISAIFCGTRNTPTWHGIIISAIIGMLPLYLILCFLGIMGRSKVNE